MSKSVAVYPGFFDPFTKGHQNIVERSCAAFDEVVIAVAKDSSKSSLFTFEERMQQVGEIFQSAAQVKVEAFEGLLVHYLEEKNYKILIRGLRTVSDFEYEFQMALANKTMSQSIETFFMMTDARYSFISSTMIKEIARLGGSVKGMVPEVVYKNLTEKFS